MEALGHIDKVLTSMNTSDATCNTYSVFLLSFTISQQFYRTEILHPLRHPETVVVLRSEIKDTLCIMPFMVIDWLGAVTQIRLYFYTIQPPSYLPVCRHNHDFCFFLKAYLFYVLVSCFSLTMKKCLFYIVGAQFTRSVVTAKTLFVILLSPSTKIPLIIR